MPKYLWGTLAYLENVGIQVLFLLSLSQTLSGWQLIENQTMLLWDEGRFQAHWLAGRRSDPVAGSA